VIRVQVCVGAFSAVVPLALLPPLTLASAQTCAAPTIEVVPRAGGQLQFKIQSPCRMGELVVGRYGELVIMERFDGNGNLVFHLDCFQGNREIQLTFKDDRRATTRSCAAVENTLTKVAIVWQGHIDLDLHALEYAAAPGSEYDRWASNPGSYQTAQSNYLRSGRSYGFMSTTSDGQKLGHNVEVYTLLRHPAEQRGLIAMGIALGAHNNFARTESCRNGTGEPLRFDLDVYILDYGARLRSYEREFIAQPCDGNPTRIVTNLIPHILLGDGRATGGPNGE
jgi:hypothetical protein